MRRLSVVVDPLNRVTQYQWCSCGALEAIIDPAGNRTSWLRDEQRRLIQKNYPDGSAMFYQYEKSTSRRKSVLDAKGQQVNFQYNIDNTVNNVSYTDASGNALSPATPGVSFTYHTAYPRVRTMVDGIGTTTYHYNDVGATPALGAGRLGSIAGPWATIAYTYDALGRVLSRSIDGAANTVSTAYDSLGRATTATNVLGAFGYRYVDTTARLAQMTYPNSQTAQFTYFGNTGDQRLQEIKNLDNHSNVISLFDYTYNAVGDITKWKLTNPMLTNPRQYAFGYDAADQLTSGPLTDTVTSAVVADLSDRYDAAGNRVTTQSGNTVVTEQPNALNQLTQTSGGGMMRFAGSVATSGGAGSNPATVLVGGNPATVNPDNSFVGYAQVASNATTAVHIVATDANGIVTDNYANITPNMVTPTVFAYDLNGNTISSGPSGAPSVTYGWDAANRLTTITQGSNVTKFDYDGQGRRVREWLNGSEVRHWIWCGLELCEERDASNTVTKRFFSQGEQIGSTSYYYTRDHLGSVREMTDASNVIHARYDYHLYGQRSANLVTTDPVDSDFGFTGHYFHASSGLYLAPYRAYNASVGRWLSRDPIGENGGVNLYGYVGNAPINYYDPFGLDRYVFQQWWVHAGLLYPDGLGGWYQANFSIAGLRITPSSDPSTIPGATRIPSTPAQDDILRDTLEDIRTGRLFNPFYDPLTWNCRHFVNRHKNDGIPAKGPGFSGIVPILPPIGP